MTLQVRPVNRNRVGLRFRWLRRVQRAIAPLAARLRNPAPPFLRVGLAALLLVTLINLLIIAMDTLGAGVNLRDLEQQRGDEDTAQLSASLIAQSFRNPRPNLAEIDVRLNTLVV